MVGIVLEGEAAGVEPQRLLEDGTEISVAVREWDAQGKKKAIWMKLGSCPSTAWVFYRVEAEGMEPQVILEEVLFHEAAELFGSCLERMMLRQGLVDPSPLSPAFVEISPCIQDTNAALEAEFGITVPLS
jgi:hypothetical protein